LIGPIRPNLDEQLSNIISEHYQNNRLTKDRQKMIRKYIHELESIMREELKTNDLRLTSFGSAVNGFGAKNSDLDLCLQSQKIIQVSVYSDWKVKGFYICYTFKVRRINKENQREDGERRIQSGVHFDGKGTNRKI
jgi:hypothetical protein